MKLLVTAAQMKTCDYRTITDYHMPSLLLMERAALAVAEEVQHRYPDGKILAVCGPGNNGGDGVAAARILRLRGYQSEIFLCTSADKFSVQMKQQMEIAKKYQIPVVKNPVFSEYTVIIDAVFGTGLSRPVSDMIAEIIDRINASETPVISVDIPSGIHADTGEVLGTAIRSLSTVTFAFEKPGLLLPPGYQHAGRIITAEIGIYDLTDPDDVHMFRLEREDLPLFLARDPQGNKGTFGKVLAAAGSHEIFGAAFLSSEAILRSGAGMLKILTEENNRLPFLMKLPEAMLELYQKDFSIDPEKLKHAAEWADIVLVGPGMGTGTAAAAMLDWFLQSSGLPLVLDADALNLAARNPRQLLLASGPVVVTPHIAEMSRLTGISVKELKKDPVRAALEFARNYQVVCVLKDARTVTASPEGRVYINTSGCSALATAGSGDVLAGLIASFLAQQRKAGQPLPVDLTVAAAVFYHGLLGELAAEETGEAFVTAGDLIRVLSKKYSFKNGETFSDLPSAHVRP